MPFLKKRIGISQLDPNQPDHQTVLREWNAIWNYYFDTAPEKLPSAKTTISQDLSGFTIIDPQYRPGKAFITLTQIDSQRRQLYVGNAQIRTLDVLDPSGKPLSSLRVASPPVSLSEQPDGWYCTLIGLVPPHNQRIGSLIKLAQNGTAFSLVREILSDLPRPTDCSFGDLNGDGREDLVVSGFGNILGELTWHENLGNGRYRKHVIYHRPGALKTFTHDFDQDGRLDIVALMAQSQEGVFVLLNDGNHQFKEYPAVRAHPAWGYAGFELVDFDRDGLMDFLTANGDNGEYPSCLKPYHGIRLYRNFGDHGFRQQFFIPLNGAFKAVPADFDLDGDLDIAAISYFPDYNKAPEESFVLLWNDGAYRFRAQTFPQSYRGRWLTMDAGDLDGDGESRYHPRRRQSNTLRGQFID
ncbi:MAG: hypothetical protein M2R45_04884 [Verrucomicrobia subdivision 3 bacterium]|nr:hypothetical protein [Limisphaerales bacterium]MCS1414378.1 hypothetical protein [Limisphaerales bacterium]